jgi:hypothetical protein
VTSEKVKPAFKSSDYYEIKGLARNKEGNRKAKKICSFIPHCLVSPHSFFIPGDEFSFLHSEVKYDNCISDS